MGHAHAGWGWCYKCGQVPAQVRCNYKKGQAVKGNWEKRGRWYDARITKVTIKDKTCSYTVHYDDGDNEVIMQSWNAGSATSRLKKRTCNVNKSYSECDRVKVNYKGRGKWYAGRVTAVGGGSGHCSKHYTITYDDGDREMHVSAKRIKVLPNNQSGEFYLHQHVKGDFRGRGKWYVGHIEKKISPCCYKVKYADGDVESCVDPKNLRAICQKDCCKITGNRVCGIGDNIEADWRGYGRWYSGQIAKPHQPVKAGKAPVSCIGGLFKIKYTDGDIENNVPKSRIKNCESCPKTSYQIGQKVYGNHKGQAYWWPGTITRKPAGADKTYRIKFDDNTMMNKVTTCHIKAWTGSQLKLWGTYMIGQTGRFKWKGGRCFKGMLCGKGTKSGTFKVCYDDGDKEDNVTKSNIFLGNKANQC